MKNVSTKPQVREFGQVRVIGRSRGKEGEKSQGRVLGASIARVRIAETREAVSRILDPFTDSYKSGELIRPLYDPGMLTRFLDYGDNMAQCVNAMATNIDGLGHFFKFSQPPGEAPRDPNPAELEELDRVEFLFETPNPIDSFSEIRKRLRIDKCVTGGRYLEVVRNLVGEIAQLYHAPAISMRMSRQEDEPVPHTQWRRYGSDWVEVELETRFRKFCQLIGGQRKVWFKQFGDPRSMNATTGEYAPAGGNWPANVEATEIIHDSYYSPLSSYGAPPWIAQIIDIVGAHEAHSVNYLYFQQKAIPPFIVTVSGGSLGTGAAEDLASYLEDQFQGTDNWNKILVLEAKGTDVGQVEGEEVTPVRIEVKPLTQFFQNDGQFLKYIATVDKAVRQSFQLPPVLIGAAEEYSHAAVLIAIKVAEKQVFSPQRKADDYLFNSTILADMGVRSWAIVSHGIPTSDDAQVVKAFSAIPDLVPVGHGVDYICELMQKDPPKLDEETRGLLLGEYRQRLRAAEPTPDPPDPNADPDEEGDGEDEVIKALKLLKSGLQKRRAPFAVTHLTPE